MRFRLLCPLWVFVLTCVCQPRALAQGPLQVINFEDGTLGQQIGNHYNQYSIIFSNRPLTTPPTGFGSPSNFIALTNELPQSNFPNSLTPIVATFQNPVNYIEITAKDVGRYGARLDVYKCADGGQPDWAK